MANARRAAAVGAMIDQAVAKGARLKAGGIRLGKRGFFYAPTVLADVPIDAEIMNEEPFGPVALINPFSDEEEAVTSANRLPYGLAAYAFTRDAGRVARLGRDIESGMVGVNTTMIGGADAPFGGVKWSGHGHEDGPEGLDACLVAKTIHEG
jgi:succinate-semialdehyde dehydrogenase/glutarate-semialdehyde dehydrogenase